MSEDVKLRSISFVKNPTLDQTRYTEVKEADAYIKQLCKDHPKLNGLNVLFRFTDGTSLLALHELDTKNPPSCKEIFKNYYEVYAGKKESSRISQLQVENMNRSCERDFGESFKDHFKSYVDLV